MGVEIDMMEHSFTVESDSRQLAGVTLGTGQPLLLIHGFPLDHTMWSLQIEALAHRCRVIAPDLRGFGRSTLSASDVADGVGMATYASDLLAVLDHLQVDEPVILCGFSMGGYILWQVALRYPERVKALVPCDTRATADSAEGGAGRLQMAEEVMASGVEPVAEAMLPKLLAPSTMANRPEIVEEVSAMIRRASPAAIAAAQRGMARRPDVQTELAGFDWPSLVLVGTEDAISSPLEMHAIAARLPQGQFCEIANAGHMSPLENSDAFNQALIAFVESLP